MNTPTGLRSTLHPDKGVAGYECDPVPGATMYTYRRNGAVVGGQGSNGPFWDSYLYPGEAYSVTVSADDSPESAPLSFTMPMPQPPRGGELLYVLPNFPDKSWTGPLPDLSAAVAYLRAATGNRMPLTATVMQVAMTRDFDYYTQPQIVDEIVQVLDLRNRDGLHRLAIDLPPPHTLQDNAGWVLWGDFWDRNSPWVSFTNAENVVHEILHTWGLGHCGFAMTLPADPDNPNVTGVYSSDVMGSPSFAGTSMNFMQRLMCGGKAPSQMVRIQASGGAYSLTPVESASGLQAVVVPGTPAGSCYVIEHRGGLPHAMLRPYKSWKSFQITELPAWVSGTNLLLNDTSRGIKVTFSNFSASGMSVTVTTSVPAPVPVPVPPAPTPTPTQPTKKPRHGRG